MLATIPQSRGFARSSPLCGRVRVPGDKSISHRALILGALCVGETRIAGLLEGEDVLATAAALAAMGATIERKGDEWVVHGVGVGGLLQPEGALAMGNSGTSTRLLMGLLASHAVTATFTGDASLSRRPMARAIEPLAMMGADFTTAPGGRLPLTMRGICPAIPIAYRLPVASAQVKSAVLLAALNTPGITRVIEPVPTRDHSERMLAGFGAEIAIETDANGARVIALTGEAELRAQTITVPGDPSSAAFLVVAATLVPGSDLVIENVGLNPTRIGLFEVLRRMGADIATIDPREVGGEPVADLRVRAAPLRGVEVEPALAPVMIDEYPILFVAACMAQGRTVVRGAGELRVKESDRIAAMTTALCAAGARIVETPDGVEIEGGGGELLPGGATIASLLDHRVAMSMAVAGLCAANPITIDDVSPVATSFPNFFALLDGVQS